MISHCSGVPIIHEQDGVTAAVVHQTSCNSCFAMLPLIKVDVSLPCLSFLTSSLTNHLFCSPFMKQGCAQLHVDKCIRKTCHECNMHEHDAWSTIRSTHDTGTGGWSLSSQKASSHAMRAVAARDEHDSRSSSSNFDISTWQRMDSCSVSVVHDGMICT